LDITPAIRDALKQYHRDLYAYRSGVLGAVRPAPFVGEDELSRREAESEFQLWDTYRSLIIATLDRFPELEKDRADNDKRFTSSHEMAIDDMQVEVIGDEAIVAVSVGVPEALRRVAGEWKYDLTKTQQLQRVFLQQPLGKTPRETVIAANLDQAKAFREVASGVKKGKYSSVEGVKADLAAFQNARLSARAEKANTTSNIEPPRNLSTNAVTTAPAR
jgi:hypothetical protein